MCFSTCTANCAGFVNQFSKIAKYTKYRKYRKNRKYRKYKKYTDKLWIDYFYDLRLQFQGDEEKIIQRDVPFTPYEHTQKIFANVMEKHFSLSVHGDVFDCILSFINDEDLSNEFDDLWDNHGKPLFTSVNQLINLDFNRTGNCEKCSIETIKYFIESDTVIDKASFLLFEITLTLDDGENSNKVIDAEARSFADLLDVCERYRELVEDGLDVGVDLVFKSMINYYCKATDELFALWIDWKCEEHATNSYLSKVNETKRASREQIKLTSPKFKRYSSYREIFDWGNDIWTVRSLWNARNSIIPAIEPQNDDINQYLVKRKQTKWNRYKWQNTTKCKQPKLYKCSRHRYHRW